MKAANVHFTYQYLIIRRGCERALLLKEIGHPKIWNMNFPESFQSWKVPRMEFLDFNTLVGIKICPKRQYGIVTIFWGFTEHKRPVTNKIKHSSCHFRYLHSRDFFMDGVLHTFTMVCLLFYLLKIPVTLIWTHSFEFTRKIIFTAGRVVKNYQISKICFLNFTSCSLTVMMIFPTFFSHTLFKWMELQFQYKSTI